MHPHKHSKLFFQLLSFFIFFHFSEAFSETHLQNTFSITPVSSSAIQISTISPYRKGNIKIERSLLPNTEYQVIFSANPWLDATILDTGLTAGTFFYYKIITQIEPGSKIDTITDSASTLPIIKLFDPVKIISSTYDSISKKITLQFEDKSNIDDLIRIWHSTTNEDSLKIVAEFVPSDPLFMGTRTWIDSTVKEDTWNFYQVEYKTDTFYTRTNIDTIFTLRIGGLLSQAKQIHPEKLISRFPVNKNFFAMKAGDTIVLLENSNTADSCSLIDVSNPVLPRFAGKTYYGEILRFFPTDLTYVPLQTICSQQIKNNLFLFTINHSGDFEVYWYKFTFSHFEFIDSITYLKLNNASAMWVADIKRVLYPVFDDSTLMLNFSRGMYTAEILDVAIRFSNNKLETIPLKGSHPVSGDNYWFDNIGPYVFQNTGTHHCFPYTNTLTLYDYSQPQHPLIDSFPLSSQRPIYFYSQIEPFLFFNNKHIPRGADSTYRSIFLDTIKKQVTLIDDSYMYIYEYSLQNYGYNLTDNIKKNSHAKTSICRNTNNDIFKIFTINGKLVKTIRHSQYRDIQNCMNSLPNGTYFLKNDFEVLTHVKIR